MTPASSTVAENAMLHVSASRVDVNDAEVPKGANRPLQLDEPVVLGTGALADIQTGDVGIVLLLGANMRLDSWNELDDISYDRALLSDLTSQRFTDAGHGVLVLGPRGTD